MGEQDKFLGAVSKAVNFAAQVALIAGAVNEFAVKFAEQVPVYAPIVAGVLAGATTPVFRFSALLSLFKKK